MPQKRKRIAPSAPIPEDAEIVILSSDDEVEIVPPPKKRVAVTQTLQPRYVPPGQNDRFGHEAAPILSPASRRASHVQDSPVSRSQAMTTSSSIPESSIAPSPTQDRRSARKSEKGALFLRSTKSALESRRTIQALRRIQLVSAGITDFRDGDDGPVEETSAAPASVAGVDTSWGADVPAGTSSTGWDQPVAGSSGPATGWGDSFVDTQVVAAPAASSNTGWGDDAPVTSGGDNGWDNEATSTNPPASASVNTGWGTDAIPATQPTDRNVNTGWGDHAPVTAGGDSGWGNEATSINPPASAGVNTGWGTDAVPATQSADRNVNTGWGDESAPTIADLGFNAASAAPSTAWDKPAENEPPATTGVSTGWGDESTAVTAIAQNATVATTSTAWGESNANMPSDSRVDTAWGEDSNSASANNARSEPSADVSLAWDEGPGTTTAAADVSSGWGDVPIISTANTGWDTAPSRNVSTWVETSTPATRPSSSYATAQTRNVRDNLDPSNSFQQRSDDGWGNASARSRESAPAIRSAPSAPRSHMAESSRPSIPWESRAADTPKVADGWSVPVTTSSSTAAADGWGAPSQSFSGNASGWGSGHNEPERR